MHNLYTPDRVTRWELSNLFHLYRRECFLLARARTVQILHKLSKRQVGFIDALICRPIR